MCVQEYNGLNRPYKKKEKRQRCRKIIINQDHKTKIKQCECMHAA